MQLLAFAVYITLVPGFPLAVHLARKADNWRLVLAAAPVFSIGANYFLLSALNIVGIRPSLWVVGALLIVATLALSARCGVPSRSEFRSLARETAAILPAAALGALIWQRAYAGYLFVAPNQDALNHNRWIARIADVGSALVQDSKVDSPLQKLGSGSTYYPMAWHSAVAVGSELSDLAIPAASLVSVAVFWIFVLPAGMSALAKLWSPQTRHLGALAAVLVQLYPLVPGVPLASGSMTSVIGVALLPVAVTLSAYMLLDSDRVLVASAVGVGATMFFIHTQEAATLSVIVFVQFLTIANERIRRNLVRICVPAALGLALTLWIQRDYIFGGRRRLEDLFGGTNPSWSNAIGSFFAMDINTALGFSILTLLFIVGLITSSRDGRDRWMIYAVVALLGVYLIAGSGSGVLSKFRILTAPWYASYERTLWVVVPFAALLSAYSIVRLLLTNTSGNLLRRSLFAALASALMIVVVFQQVVPVIAQLRSGPARSAMIGPRDLELLAASRSYIGPDEIAIGSGADGTIYPFIYYGLKVTGGMAIGRDGEPSHDVAVIMGNLPDLCSNPEARASFARAHVAALFLAKRGVGGAAQWTDAEARQLKGLDVVLSGELLMLLVPHFEECT